jgi:hypothetical protein
MNAASLGIVSSPLAFPGPCQLVGTDFPFHNMWPCCLMVTRMASGQYVLLPMQLFQVALALCLPVFQLQFLLSWLVPTG